VQDMPRQQMGRKYLLDRMSASSQQIMRDVGVVFNAVNQLTSSQQVHRAPDTG